MLNLKLYSRANISLIAAGLLCSFVSACASFGAFDSSIGNDIKTLQSKIHQTVDYWLIGEHAPAQGAAGKTDAGKPDYDFIITIDTNLTSLEQRMTVEIPDSGGFFPLIRSQFSCLVAARAVQVSRTEPDLQEKSNKLFDHCPNVLPTKDSEIVQYMKDSRDYLDRYLNNLLYRIQSQFQILSGSQSSGKSAGGKAGGDGSGGA